MLRKFLIKFYRFLNQCLSFGIARLIFSKGRLEQTLSHQGMSSSVFSSVLSQKQQRIWFHAASVGELESLWTLILKAADQGNALVITVLSESAQHSIEGLRKVLQNKKATVIFIGYSPLEGDWYSALLRVKPHLFVTAKYEAWPELWMSLAEFDIPLSIVSAQVRKSLLLAKKICLLISGRLPRMSLFVCQKDEIHSLQASFKDACVEYGGEPRWDRVNERRFRGSVQAKELIQLLESRVEKPWGVLGSAWIEDLRVFEKNSDLIPGTLWIVPHRVDSDSIREFCDDLEQKLKIFPILTSDRAQLARQLSERDGLGSARFCILVNEMGFLSELYACADWVFIGGGFGAGVHSTIEPAVYGVPLACGPQGVKKFSEISELQKTKQLTVVSDSLDLQQWLKQMKFIISDQKLRQQRILESENRLGATQKIWDALEKMISAC